MKFVADEIPLQENACLETVKVGNDYQLANSDDHKHILKKRKRESEEARPDIVHQVTTPQTPIPTWEFS